MGFLLKHLHSETGDQGAAAGPHKPDFLLHTRNKLDWVVGVLRAFI